jgi:tripartite-type tricarboxylate transporter receptor subunit TctC
MEVNSSVPVKTVPEFIAYAKVNSSKVNLASFGNGDRFRQAHCRRNRKVGQGHSRSGDPTGDIP